VAEEFGEELTGVPEGGEFPLLVKILFPNDKLSVQVHPDDAHAQAMGQAVVLPAKCGEVILKAEEHASFVLCAAQSGDPR
jgi:mannose-6-phosphate isomerase class I